MKHSLILASAITLLAACSIQEMDIQPPIQDDVVFFASFEQPSENDTRVYANEDLLLRWTADDRVSIFNRNTYNQQYAFTGETGDNAGGFRKVESDEFMTGNAISNIVSVYPYQMSTKIAENGSISVTLPAVQAYAEDTFGLGANTMASVTSDNFLQYKNVGGYLVLKLYGDGISVSSITLKGNKGEKLAGKATVTMPLNGVPTVAVADDATPEITLTCESPVLLGTTPEESTLFWFVVPPVSFSEGFTITVSTPSGGTFEKSTSKSVAVERNNLSKMSPIEVVPVQPKYLAFISEGTTTVSLVNEYGMNAPVLYYSFDQTDWTEWDYSELTFTSSQPLYFRGKNPEGFSTESYRFSHFKTEGSNFEVSGDIMSLIDSDQELISIPSIYCFYRLFSGCVGLTKAPTLPATTLAQNCYREMFAGCTGLTTAPTLPATTLAEGCYAYMFNDCTSLTTAPDLPAATLAKSCYVGMFYRCTSLITAPSLPAATLAEGCYGGMFDGCTRLTTAPDLPATTLAPSCYQYMFEGCTSLTTAPDLPATTLGQSCYEGMFYDCTSLTTAPDLPATTLGQSCYKNMFYGCTSLTTAPYLSATTLAQSCCAEMFRNCTSLTTAPNLLPATTLAPSCYYMMFYGCTSLLAAPDLPATTLAPSCYSEMFWLCTSMTSAPSILPATTLASWCYYNMFSGCTSLTAAPDLPATTLAPSCYSHMFDGCTSLTQAPDLPAPTLVENCYEGMFNGCSKLNHIKCLATDILDTISHCVSGWTYGVASSGTFIKASEMNDWQWGSSGVPNGWIIQNDGDPGLSTSKYLTFTSEGTTTISLSNYEGNAPVLYYSTDKTNWATWDYSPLTFSSEQPLYLCGDNPEGFYSETGGYSSFISSGSFFGVSGDIMSLIDKEHDLDYIRPKHCFYRLFANCKGLISAPDLPARMLSVGCYDSMFVGCTNLTKAPALPATTLTRYCYYSMFSGCTSLTEAPALPATTVEEACYHSMFYRCTNLTTAPDLPAARLELSCYYRMFSGCSKLNYIKCLATDFNEEQGALDLWLEGVASIGTFIKTPGVITWRKGSSGIPKGWAIRNEGGSDPAEAKYLTFTSDGETTISLQLTNNRDQTPLLYYSTDKTTWKIWPIRRNIMSTDELTFTSDQPLYICGHNPDGINPNGDKYWCYFRSSGSNFSVSGSIMTLINAEQELSAIPSDNCFYSLFSRCTGLISAPDLPATSLTSRCYAYMFSYCTNLTKAPDILPATTLAEECYLNMFSGCQNLTTAPDLPAPMLATKCYYAMFVGCNSLNYVKCLATDISATDCVTGWLSWVPHDGTFVKAPGMNDWPTGYSGIPEGWTVLDAE